MLKKGFILVLNSNRIVFEFEQTFEARCFEILELVMPYEQLIFQENLKCPFQRMDLQEPYNLRQLNEN